MPQEIQETFVTLLQDAWRNASETRRKVDLVEEAVPILFFGRASTARVATVGLNPSPYEFPMPTGAMTPSPRFYVPPPEHIDQELPPEEALKALQGMHWYFHVKPYAEWFYYVDAFLHGLGASIINGTAAHTDIISPFATKKPYGKLDDEQKQLLAGFGVDCWRRVLLQMPELKAIVGMGASWEILRDRFGVEFEDIDIPFQEWIVPLPEVLPQPKVGTWELNGRRLQVYWWQRFWKKPFTQRQRNHEFLGELPGFYCKLGRALSSERPWARLGRKEPPAASPVPSPVLMSFPTERRGVPRSDEPVDASERKLLRRLKAHPSDDEALHALLVLYDQTNRQAKVVATIERHLPYHQETDARAHLRLLQGCAQEKRGRYFQAQRCYEVGIREEPNDARTAYFLHNNLGFCRNELGLFQSAEAPCRTAVAMNPGIPNAWKNLGTSLKGQDDWLGAAWALIEALKINPRYAKAWRALHELLDQHPYLLDQDHQLAGAIKKFDRHLLEPRALPLRPRRNSKPCKGERMPSVTPRFRTANELAVGFLDHLQEHPDAKCLDDDARGVRVWAHAWLWIDGKRIGVHVNSDTTRKAVFNFCRAMLLGQPTLVLGTTEAGTGRILLGSREQSKGLYIYVDSLVECSDGAA